MRVLPERGHELIGLDVLDSTYTSVVGSITIARLKRSSRSAMLASICP